jgi:hypothetical protein
MCNMKNWTITLINHASLLHREKNWLSELRCWLLFLEMVVATSLSLILAMPGEALMCFYFPATTSGLDFPLAPASPSIWSLNPSLLIPLISTDDYSHPDP